MKNLAKKDQNLPSPGKVVGNLSTEVGRFSVSSFFSPDAVERAYQASSFGVEEEVDITITAIRESAEKGDFSTALQGLRHHRNIIRQAATAAGMFDRQTQLMTQTSNDGKTTVTVRTETSRILEAFKRENERNSNQEVREIYLEAAHEPEASKHGDAETDSTPPPSGRGSPSPGSEDEEFGDPGDEGPNAEVDAEGDLGGLSHRTGGSEGGAGVRLVHDLSGCEPFGDERVWPDDPERDLPGTEDEDEDEGGVYEDS